MKNPTIKEIVQQYLVDNDYDGLFFPGECACLKENLFPCGSGFEECTAGYKTECTCGQGCDFDIAYEKE